jgi:hypothetical protein
MCARPNINAAIHESGRRLARLSKLTSGKLLIFRPALSLVEGPDLTDEHNSLGTKQVQFVADDARRCEEVGFQVFLPQLFAV